MNFEAGNRPLDLILTRILVPPSCIRPSVMTDGGGTYEKKELYSSYVDHIISQE